MDLKQFIDMLRTKSVAESNAYILEPKNRPVILEAFSSVTAKFSTTDSLRNTVHHRTGVWLNERDEAKPLFKILTDLSDGASREGKQERVKHLSDTKITLAGEKGTRVKVKKAPTGSLILCTVPTT